MNYFVNENIINVLDCGCGNGRDSYTLSQKYKVHGVDNCGYLPKNAENVEFFINNFVTMDKKIYDLVYSKIILNS